MNLSVVILASVWTYFKNIVVNLFFSALMILLPYLQYMLIANSAELVVSSLLVFISAFASVIFVYVPFVVSIHRARITLLWRKLLRSTLFLSLIWAIICGALFCAMYYCLQNVRANAVAIVLLFAVLMFVVWETIILKSVNIVCNAEKEPREKNTLLSALRSAKSNFAVVSMLGFGGIIAVPVLAEIKKLDNLLLYPEVEQAGEKTFGTLVLSSKEAVFFYVFLLLPFLAIMLYECYTKASAETPVRHSATDSKSF